MSLDLGWETLQIKQLGFGQMTPVQASTIPLFLQHKDVVVEAVTGSGKSLAFVIPTAEMLLKKKLGKNQLGALIVTPTRELATQVYSVMKHFEERTLLLIGGAGSKADTDQIEAQGASVFVGTPGRILEMLDCVDTRELQVLILDEADRLLDMGFETALTGIISKVPKQRRTGLFSATMTEAVSDLVKAGLRNPVKIVVKQDSSEEMRIPASLDVFYAVIEVEKKLDYLVAFLNENKSKKTIVYFATCAIVDYFYKVLKAKMSNLFALHGKMEHNKRTKVYKGFVESASGVLFCTDLASRGLDIPELDWVLQFDMPQDPSNFIHRCGRTARSGKEGKALVFLMPNEIAYVDFLALKKIPMRQVSLSPPADSFLNDIKALIRSDRDYLDKSVFAFVSYFRSYQEHHCNFIFKVKDLDFVGLLRLFCILKVPKMPELKVFKDLDYEQEETKSIKYLDKSREASRLKKEAERGNVKKKKQSAPWSLKKEKKEKKIKKKMKTKKISSDEEEDWKEFKRERREEKLKKTETK